MTEPKQAELLGSSRVFGGRVVDLWLERVRLPNGAETELEVVRHVGGAAALPVLENGDVVLVRQYRHATGEWLLEVPAGKVKAGETPELVARRELEEETGLCAKRMEPLGYIWTTPGFSDERIHLFVATGLEPGQQKLSPSEVLSIVQLPLPEAIRQARSGELKDAKSVCALLRLDQAPASRLTV